MLLVGAALAWQARGADGSDVAEQLFEEAALAAESRSFLTGRVDVHDQFPPRLLDRRHIPLPIETDDHHRLLGHVRIAECDLVHVSRYIIPVVGRELASETWAAESLLDRILVVDSRLNCAGHLRIEDHAFVRTKLRAPGEHYSRRENRHIDQRTLHSLKTFMEIAALPAASPASICGRQGATQACSTHICN